RLPLRALHAAGSADTLDLLLELCDALCNAPSVRFQFCFAGPACPDAAAQPRHLHAASRQSGQQVIELGKLNLQLPFPGASSRGKDVEYQLSAVDDFAVESTLKIPQLRGAEFAVEDNGIDEIATHARLDLVYLSGPD